MRDRKSLMRKRMFLSKEGGALSSVSVCMRMVGDRGFFLKKKGCHGLCFMIPPNVEEFSKYSSPPLFMRNMFHDPHWMPETVTSIKPYIYYVILYTYVSMIKFNL